MVSLLPAEDRTARVLTTHLEFVGVHYFTTSWMKNQPVTHENKHYPGRAISQAARCALCKTSGLKVRSPVVKTAMTGNTGNKIMHSALAAGCVWNTYYV